MRSTPSLLLAALLAALTVGVASATMFVIVGTGAPWLDPNQVRGTLVDAAEAYAGTAIECTGTVTDPNYPAAVFTAAVDGPGTVTFSGAGPIRTWLWSYRTALADVNQVRYARVTFTETPPANRLLVRAEGFQSAGTVTFAFRTLPAPKPDVKYGGCRAVD